MESNKIEYKSVGVVHMPDGVFYGTLTGDTVKFERNTNYFEFKVTPYIAGTQCNVSITVKDMHATVKEIR